MGGNITSGNFLGGNFQGGNSPGGNFMGGTFLDGSFPGGIFLIPIYLYRRKYVKKLLNNSTLITTKVYIFTGSFINFDRKGVITWNCKDVE